MSPKSFSVLFILTLFALIAAMTIIFSGQNFGHQKRAGEAAIPNLLEKINKVEKIIIKHSKGNITLISNGGKWKVEEISSYPARTIKIKRAILGLAQLKLSEPKTRLKNKYSKLELLDPDSKGANSKRVSLFDKEGKIIGDIIVGKRRPSMAGTTGGGLYLRNPDKSQTWLADGDVDISKNITEWLERKIINLDSKRVKQVVIRHADGETLKVFKNTIKEQLFSLSDIPSDKKIASVTEPSTIGKALENLLLEDVKKDADAPSFELAKSLVADYTTFDGLALRIYLFNLKGEFWIKIEAFGEHRDVDIINKRTEGWVYKIAEYSASILTRRVKDLVKDAKPDS